MNKECRMSKESGLTNFIILHSLFLVRYSKNYFLPKNGKTLQQGNLRFKWKNSIHRLIFFPSIPEKFNIYTNYFIYLTGKMQSSEWKNSIFRMETFNLQNNGFQLNTGPCPVNKGKNLLSIWEIFQSLTEKSKLHNGKIQSLKSYCSRSYWDFRMVVPSLMAPVPSLTDQVLPFGPVLINARGEKKKKFSK